MRNYIRSKDFITNLGNLLNFLVLLRADPHLGLENILDRSFLHQYLLQGCLQFQLHIRVPLLPQLVVPMIGLLFNKFKFSVPSAPQSRPPASKHTTPIVLSFPRGRLFTLYEFLCMLCIPRWANPHHPSPEQSNSSASPGIGCWVRGPALGANPGRRPPHTRTSFACPQSCSGVDAQLSCRSAPIQTTIGGWCFLFP
jgi:hypothetical protein